MQKKQEVLEKFNEMRMMELRKRKSIFLSKRPINCFFNFKQRIKGNGEIGFCQNSEVINSINNKVFVCNDEETAKNCKFFQCRNTEESVIEDFNEILSSPTRCGSDYPKLAMMIWFLQDFEIKSRFGRLKVIISSIVNNLVRLLLFRWW